MLCNSWLGSYDCIYTGAGNIGWQIDMARINPKTGKPTLYGRDVIRGRDIGSIVTQAIVVLIITKMFFFP